MLAMIVVAHALAAQAEGGSIMDDSKLKGVLDELETYEGRVAWLYNDSANPPNVTVGVGCLVPSVEAAQAMPFTIDGRPANAQEKAVGFLRVQGMPGGLRAGAYWGRMRLSDADIDACAFVRLRAMLADLPDVFPAFDGFPLGVQQVLLDLAWNCGLGEAPGLRGWTHLREALAQVPPDYASAAKECTTANPNNLASREARNAWRAQSFIDAAAAQGVS